MKILLTGAGGVIGRALMGYFENSQDEVIPVDIVEDKDLVCADLRNPQTVTELIREYKPEVVIHLAANKNVSYCEKHIEATSLINYGITRNLVNSCAGSSVYFMYFSSDYVFGPEKTGWNEEADTCPTTQYGRDKVASELEIQNRLESYAIIRTAGLYGFKNDFIDFVRKTLSEGKVFNAFENLVNCPTSVSDLYQMMAILLDIKITGIFHCIGAESMSRFQFAQAVAEAFSLDKSLITGELLDFTKDIRPHTLALNGDRTYQRLHYTPSSLSENLARIT